MEPPLFPLSSLWAQGYRIWNTECPRRKNNRSFPRKRDSSGLKIGLIVLAKAASYRPGKNARKRGGSGFPLSRE